MLSAFKSAAEAKGREVRGRVERWTQQGLLTIFWSDAVVARPAVIYVGGERDTVRLFSQMSEFGIGRNVFGASGTVTS